MDDNYKYSSLTEKIIKAFYSVYNKMGYGFLEKVYENSMVIELKKMELDVSTQLSIPVFYDGIEVGHYFADLVVNEQVIVELKASESLCEEHEAQLLNYLRATEKEVGLLLNFGVEPEIKRKVFSNDRKNQIKS
ncbi:MAG: GxxExxY protein [Chitinophagaceae bacterium]|nr:MAG: GxxExxY protein [Chitinophagaceae bacterium]